MAKKNTKQQKQSQVSPEKYMKTRVRSLPIEKCYVNTNWQDAGIAFVVVTRRHTQGTHSFGAFLVDTWCRGVYDAYYGVNVDDERLKALLENPNESITLEEVEYALVHNIVYGAVAYAEDARIEPHKSFNIAQYILEEDTDDSPFMDLEFGKNGKYFLMMSDQDKAQYYLNLLDKNIGRGNYDYLIDLPNPDDQYNQGVDGEYAYFRPERPNADISALHHKELVDILSQDIGALKDNTVKEILSIDPKELRDDLHTIIISTIHDNWEAIEDDDDSLENINYNLLPNSLRFLAEVADESSAEVVFEVLRQSNSFSDFYFGDSQEDFFSPVVFKLFGDNLEPVFEFMKERGPSGFSKSVLIESLTNEIIVNAPEKYNDLYNLYGKIFDYYLEHNDDEYLWDGGCVGILVIMALECGFKDLLPKITKLYETGKVDEAAAGSLSEVERDITDQISDTISAYSLDIYQWIKDYKKKWGKD